MLLASNLAGDRVLVSEIVLAEAYFALQAKYRVPKAEALLRLRELVESGEVEAGIAAEVLQTPSLASAKPGFVDRLIHAGYGGEGARLVSFEKSAGKLPNTRVLA